MEQNNLGMVAWLTFIYAVCEYRYNGNALQFFLRTWVWPAGSFI